MRNAAELQLGEFGLFAYRAKLTVYKKFAFLFSESQLEKSLLKTGFFTTVLLKETMHQV